MSLLSFIKQKFTRKKLREKEQIIQDYKNYFSESHSLPTIRIELGKETYNTYIDKWEENKITFVAPMKGSDFLGIPDSSVVNIFLQIKDQLYMAAVKIIYKYIEEQELLYVAEIIGPLEKKQQREHFRFELSIPVTILNEQNEINGTSINISAGGIRFASNEILIPSQNHWITFYFQDHLFESIPIKILEYRQNSSKTAYIYRSQFNPISLRDEDLLAKMIFMAQKRR